MQVSKWGNSLAVRLPRSLVERLQLRPGDELAIVAAEDHVLAVQKQDQRAAALARLARRAWTLPPDYRFNFEDAIAG